MENLDQININFNAESLFWVNSILSLVMFSVALEIKWSDFNEVFKNPKMILIGIISQYLLLPLITVLLIQFIPIQPSIALGLLLVAVCPGGNISNFFTLLSKGNTALSISLTSIATLVSGFAIPLGFYFWSFLSPITAGLIHEVSVDYIGILKISFLLLFMPLISGMLFSKFFPEITNSISKHLQKTSIAIFAILIIGAFASNFEHFIQLFHIIFWLVLLHNGLTLFLAYNFAKLMGLKRKERKTIAIETGVQNSGIGLVIVFNFFPNLGGMAIIVAWWGIWHLVSGMSLALLFQKMEKTNPNHS